MRKILIGVTIDDSLQFHTGLPQLLVARGWDVHVVSGDGRRIRALSALPGITTHVLEMKRNVSPLRDVVALVAWSRLIRRVRPDVTLIGTPKAALLGNIAARLHRVPRRVYDLLGLRLETATGPLRTVLLSMERITARSASQVLAVSASVERLAVEFGIVPDDQALVLGLGSCNGVDVDRYRALSSDSQSLATLRAGLGLDPSVPTIGFVGRLTRDKGLTELAAALQLLHDRGVAVQLLVVGGVDDESGQAALALLGRSAQRIVTAGYQPDPAPYYSVMDVFCLPSLREGLPNVVLEAMASGTVVVASDATGNIDLIRDGETGYLAPRSSEMGLADALQRAVGGAPETAEIISRAREFVEANYSTRDVQARLVEFLEIDSATSPARPR